MAIERDGKIYRNLQEQVLKNKEDIENLVLGEIGTIVDEHVEELIDAAAIKRDGSNSPTHDISWNDKGIVELGFIELDEKTAKPSAETDIWKDSASNVHVTCPLVADFGINNGGFPITNVGEPSNDMDAANKEYVDTLVSAATGGAGGVTETRVREILAEALQSYLLKASGEAVNLSVNGIWMDGTISAQNRQISAVGNPIYSDDAATKQYVDGRTPTFMSEWGISDGWQYIKWDNGIAMCWCQVSHTTASTDYATVSKNYPFAFITEPNVQITSTGAGGWLKDRAPYSSGSTTGVTIVYRNAGANQEYSVFNVAAFGRWK